MCVAHGSAAEVKDLQCVPRYCQSLHDLFTFDFGEVGAVQSKFIGFRVTIMAMVMDRSITPKFDQAFGQDGVLKATECI